MWSRPRPWFLKRTLIHARTVRPSTQAGLPDQNRESDGHGLRAKTREVIVRVPIPTPVEWFPVVVNQVAIDVTTVPAVVTTHRVVTMPGTLDCAGATAAVFTAVLWKFRTLRQFA